MPLSAAELARSVAPPICLEDAAREILHHELAQASEKLAEQGRLSSIDIDLAAGEVWLIRISHREVGGTRRQLRQEATRQAKDLGYDVSRAYGYILGTIIAFLVPLIGWTVVPTCIGAFQSTIKLRVPETARNAEPYRSSTQTPTRAEVPPEVPELPPLTPEPEGPEPEAVTRVLTHRTIVEPTEDQGGPA